MLRMSSVLTVVACTAAVADAGDKVSGLAKKRAEQTVNSEGIPYVVEAIKRDCPKADVKVEVDWASLSDSAAAYDTIGKNKLALSNALLNVGNALKRVCKDDIGRQAVTDGLKVIKVAHKDGSNGDYKLEGGTLTVELDLTKDTKVTSQAIDEATKAIEKGL